MNIELIEELKDLKQKYSKLEDKYYTLAKSNEQKKEDNFKLRAENKSLKHRNYELTILVDTFLKTKKAKKTKNKN